MVITETDQKDCDSEDETQFGVVWEKMTDEQKSMAEAEKTRLEADKPLAIEYEGEAWKEKVYPFVFVPETEDQAIQKKKDITVTIEEVPTGETCVGKTIMKQFAEGLFKSQVVTATKKRGRYLYHVVYGDGDEEDLNDVEFIEAYELFYKAGNKTYEAVEEHSCHDDSENDNDKSGGETEGSEYDMSEDESVDRKRKKRRKRHNKPLKEKETNGGKKTSKEEDTTKTIKKTNASAIDVQALLKSGNKKSGTNRTMAAMTAEEQTEIIGTAEKSLMKQAKKGLRVEAMKVIPCSLTFVLSFNYLFL